MVEIPEHLRKRAAEARAKAEGATTELAADDAPSAASAATPAGVPAAGDAEKIPAHLLDRGVPAADQPASSTPAPAVGTGVPVAGSGPDGHNQRLLTVVKSGSIQDVKAVPTDKVHVWPHLLVAEFLSALAITLFTVSYTHLTLPTNREV